jgi:ATP-dependent DNA helicase HFM1/MER3
LWLQLAIARARFVAVSATIPNVADIAAWLHVPPGGLHVFGQEHRPCKLQTFVRGYNMPHKDYLFEPRLRDHLFGIIREFSQGKPSLIFCRYASIAEVRAL